MQIPGELNPSVRFLMGPGPSDVHPRILKAMATPLVGHLDPQFLTIMNDIKAMLQAVFKTKNDLTFAVSGTGSAGMETVLVNLLEPGDEAVICIHGVFGGRLADIAGRCGATVTKVEAPWGTPIDPQQVAAAVAKGKPKLVAIVHAETSTGVRQPLEEISKIVHGAGALLVVDAVTSLGGIDLRVDDWNIDAVYSGTQKCLGAPPSLSPVSFSAAAVAALEKRKTKVQSWYLDMSMVRNYWGAKRAYHHTAPISSIYALREALRMVLEEGLDARFARHAKNHERLREGLKPLGIEFLVAPEYRLPQLNAVKIPTGVDDAAVRRQLLDEFNIEIGGGLGDFTGKVWRIGLMGASSTPNHVDMLLAALTQLLRK
ncbi:MAG: pyridoxal-phosphate-dependent aminotransferase family protein [Planctomycetota bacterium]